MVNTSKDNDRLSMNGSFQPSERLPFKLVLLLILVWVTGLMGSLTPTQAEPLTVYTDNWAPYNFVRNKQLIGISTEVVQAALDDVTDDYTIKVRPWARAYKEVLNTPNTAIFTIQRSPQRERLFKWAGPIVNSDIYLYKLKSRADIKINTFTDVLEYRTGVLNKGAVYQYLVSQGLTDQQMHIHSHAQSHLNLLFAGRVDLIPGDEIDLKYQSKINNFDYNRLEKVWMLYEGRYHIAFNQGVSDELINKVQIALDKLNQSELVGQVVNHYVYQFAPQEGAFN